MPRDGNGVAQPVPGTGSGSYIPNTTIESSKQNSLVADIYALFNEPWPVEIGLGSAGRMGSWDAISGAGASIAAAATLDLDSATGPFVDITGTTPVTAVTLTAGRQRIARAAGAFRLTASASLIVNGSTTQSYTATAGDLLLFEGYASSIVRVWVISTWAPGANPYPPGTLYGLTLSNNASDATNDIDIAVGSCRSSDDSANIDLLSALTKRLDASWAVGSGNGGLDTGSIANTTYHVWLIKRSDTGVVDALFSTSATAPTMPTNYDLKRRIGSILRESGAIVAFTQNGDLFRRISTKTERSSTAAYATALLTFTGVPAGIQCQPLINLGLDVGASVAVSMSLGSAAQGTVDSTNVCYINGSQNARINTPPIYTTNTSAQIYFNQSNLAGTPSLSTITTLGWIETRGR